MNSAKLAHYPLMRGHLFFDGFEQGGYPGNLLEVDGSLLLCQTLGCDTTGSLVKLP